MINAATSSAPTAGNAAAPAANAADSTAAAANAADAVIAAAAGPAWQDPFCSRYAHLLFEYGRWFLLAALIIGTIGALAAIVKLFRSEAADDQAGGNNVLQSSIAALTALIDSLAKAPTWLAMLGAALVLMWMSGHALPTFCDGAQSDDRGSGKASAPARSSGAGRGTANASADDESGG